MPRHYDRNLSYLGKIQQQLAYNNGKIQQQDTIIHTYMAIHRQQNCIIIILDNNSSLYNIVFFNYIFQYSVVWPFILLFLRKQKLCHFYWINCAFYESGQKKIYIMTSQNNTDETGNEPFLNKLFKRPEENMTEVRRDGKDNEVVCKVIRKEYERTMEVMKGPEFRSHMESVASVCWVSCLNKY